MKSFPLTIVTPDGIKYEGQAQELVVRSTAGDLGILAGHVSCVAPLGMGRATVVMDGERKYAACIGGILSVREGRVKLVPTTFEWAEEIDGPRADRSAQRAKTVLADPVSTDTQIALAEARLKRALVRKGVAASK